MAAIDRRTHLHGQEDASHEQLCHASLPVPLRAASLRHSVPRGGLSAVAAAGARERGRRRRSSCQVALQARSSRCCNTLLTPRQHTLTQTRRHAGGRRLQGVPPPFLQSALLSLSLSPSLAPVPLSPVADAVAGAGVQSRARLSPCTCSRSHVARSIQTRTRSLTRAHFLLLECLSVHCMHSIHSLSFCRWLLLRLLLLLLMLLLKAGEMRREGKRWAVRQPKLGSVGRDSERQSPCFRFTHTRVRNEGVCVQRKRKKNETQRRANL